MTSASPSLLALSRFTQPSHPPTQSWKASSGRKKKGRCKKYVFLFQCFFANIHTQPDGPLHVGVAVPVGVHGVHQVGVLLKREDDREKKIGNL